MSSPDKHARAHLLSLDELCARLASCPRGLSTEEARSRLIHDGPNVLSEGRRTPLLLRLARHLTHRFAVLLWIGAGLALTGEHFSPGEGMALIAAALVAVVVLNAAFSFWQELSVERAMRAFSDLLARRARVLRDEIEVEVDIGDVVVGDVLVLREGDRVPADARLLEAHALQVDNSPLTGESEPELRTTAIAGEARLDAHNLVFSGTLVTSGTGSALVFRTGNDTELGRIAGVTQQTERVETPIRRELGHFTRVISVIAVALGVAFFAAGALIGNPFWTNLVFAIGIIVANVPEGLLPTVTLALAIAGRKMAKRNALLKTLESAETLGCTTVICTDKTGTLTRNEIRVADLILSSAPDAEGDLAPGDPVAALRVMALCNNATLTGRGASATATGEPTEAALLYHVERIEPGAVQRLRALHPRLHERPFDSTTKEMATLNQTPAGAEALLKGAPEVVIGHCSRIVSAHGLSAMTPDIASHWRRVADDQARRGRRVLALASKLVELRPDLVDRPQPSAQRGLDDLAEHPNFAFLGLVAMQDPPRDEVASAVEQCRSAGVRVIVISGDHPLTVEAIAKQVGIVHTRHPAVYTGAQMEAWGDAALRRALDKEEVLFARTSPLDKLRIVAALQALGHVVAVTGDGVNDAPALKRADIGIAMGRTGTDVAREAAQVVLMDDNFSTIVAAIQEGRVIYANIRRFVGYVLTSNVPEILPYVAFVLLDIPLPLPVLLVLAIDLGTDIAPAVGLASEHAEEDVMHRPPRSPNERLLSRSLLLSSYLGWGVAESLAGFGAYFWVLTDGGWRWGQALAPTDALYARSIAAFFVAIVICQVANVMIWRSTRQSVFAKGLLSNRAVVTGVCAELLLLWFIVNTNAGNRVFGTAAPGFEAWLVPIPVALSMLLASEAFKAARRAASSRHGGRRELSVP